MTIAVLSLGSNMGDSAAILRRACQALQPVTVGASGMYRTPPWGPVEQDDFLNMIVIAADPQRTAYDWLDLAHGLEQQAHRERNIHWGPRTLDVDVVTVSDNDGRPVISDDPQLILPHPRAAERAFVLLPWMEIEPGAVLPGQGRIADLLTALDTSAISRVE